MARILIADDHAVVRAGLRQFLEEDRDIVEIGEASTGNETLELLRDGIWDLVILDIYMPDRSGLDILKQIRATHPGTKILIISGLPERQYALGAIKSGASGYLAKDSAADELVKAVYTVMRGRRYVSPNLAELLVEDLNEDGDRPLHARLSDREFQIFGKLAEGRSVSQIAAELYLSVKTVSTYRKRVLEKMSLATNADLTLYAVRNGMIR